MSEEKLWSLNSSLNWSSSSKSLIHETGNPVFSFMIQRWNVSPEAAKISSAEAHKQGFDFSQLEFSVCLNVSRFPHELTDLMVKCFCGADKSTAFLPTLSFFFCRFEAFSESSCGRLAQRPLFLGRSDWQLTQVRGHFAHQMYSILWRRHLHCAYVSPRKRLHVLLIQLKQGECVQSASNRGEKIMGKQRASLPLSTLLCTSHLPPNCQEKTEWMSSFPDSLDLDLLKPPTTLS